MNPGLSGIPVPSNDAPLAWFFVSVWGRGFVATKIGLQHAAPFTCLALRFCLETVCLLPVLQRRLLLDTDLWPTAFIQFVATLVVLAPLAFVVEAARMEWAWQLFAAMLFLVALASILSVSALHMLTRRGQATHVSRILYLPPTFAVAALPPESRP
ncbi:MAG: hypothetical protein ACKO15_15840 [Burkholderiales bacterium]